MRLLRLEKNPVDNPIRIDKKDHVLEVTIDRPKANAIDLATSRVMGKVFRDFRDDPDWRVAILTAAGGKFFSAGWDLKAAADGDAVDGDYGVGGFGGLPGTLVGRVVDDAVDVAVERAHMARFGL